MRRTRRWRACFPRLVRGWRANTGFRRAIHCWTALAILGRDAHYDRMLALARLGILPFFLLACAMVFLWGNRTGGPLAGLIATFLFTTIPPVLAHAGLVTTDMAATAFTAAGAYAGAALGRAAGPAAHGRCSASRSDWG